MSSPGNVVVLLRLCGRVFAVKRVDQRIETRLLRRAELGRPKGSGKPLDQRAALLLLRKD